MSLKPPFIVNKNHKFKRKFCNLNLHTRVCQHDFDQVSVFDLEHLGALALAVDAIGRWTSAGAESALVDHVRLGEQRERGTRPGDVVQLRCHNPHVLRLCGKHDFIIANFKLL